jgi:hypothetical protein
MECLGGYLRGLVIFSVFLALSLGTAVAANTPVSVGTNVIKIIGVNYMAVDQWVEIANEGTDSTNLSGWMLMNMENQKYSFPSNFTLKAGSIFKVHARKGNNTATDLYNSGLAWNRNSDTATLKDAAGKIVSEYKYPIKAAIKKATKVKPLILPNTFSSGRMSPNFQAGYEPHYVAERGSLKSNSPVTLSGSPFICHGGPLNWAWTTGLR